MYSSFVIWIHRRDRMQNSYDVTEEKSYVVRDIDDHGNVFFYNDRDELHLVTQDDIDSGAVKLFSPTMRSHNVRQRFFGKEIRNIKEWWK